MVNKIKLLQMLLTVLALSVAVGAQAKMYKWVDENGVTQYTQTPPPGDIESKTIEPKIGPAPNPPKNKSADTGMEKASEKEEKQAETDDGDEISDAEYKAQIKQACESARKSYQSFQRPRVNIKDKDGNMRVAGEDERQAGLERAEAAIKKYCK